MSTQTAATLQALLEGVPLPAARADLIKYARRQPGGEVFAGELTRIPDREYRSLDEVGEALAPVQPERPELQSRLPQPESGEPPGGAAYTRG